MEESSHKTPFTFSPLLMLFFSLHLNTMMGIYILRKKGERTEQVAKYKMRWFYIVPCLFIPTPGQAKDNQISINALT